MNKKPYIALTSITIALSLLPGCQSLTGYNQINEVEKTEVWAGKINPIAGEVNISCSGTYHCEIAQIDKTLVIAPDTHKPVDPAMLSYMTIVDNIDYEGNDDNDQYNLIIPLSKQDEIKVVPLSASGMAGMTNYYARIKPAKREVHVNFYPENNVGYVERFAMIHEFTEAGTYQLRAYRKKPVQDAGSLLETASPDPLCVDLLQDSTIKRRFCKKMNSERQGEFVETGMVDAVDKIES